MRLFVYPVWILANHLSNVEIMDETAFQCRAKKLNLHEISPIPPFLFIIKTLNTNKLKYIL